MKFLGGIYEFEIELKNNIRVVDAIFNKEGSCYIIDWKTDKFIVDGIYDSKMNLYKYILENNYDMKVDCIHLIYLSIANTYRVVPVQIWSEKELEAAFGTPRKHHQELNKVS